MGIRRLGRLLRAGLIVWAMTFAGVLAVMLFSPKTPAFPAEADAIICLGAGMSLDGWERPDAASERRALTCARLHDAGVAPRILFTGYGHEVFSAAQAMANTAATAGVPETALIVEPHAASTLQNAAFALDMLGPDTARLVVVSDAFHLPRAWAIFRMFGVPEVALYPAGPDAPGADTTGRGLFGWAFRESLAIWANVARAAAYGLGGLAGIEHDTRIAWFD